MYETNKPKVRLDGEVDFMRNYIDLMKLRCNEMTTVSAQFARWAHPDFSVADLHRPCMTA